MITYKRNKNLDELTGVKEKSSRLHLQIIKGEAKSCNASNKLSLCCTQIVKTKT